MKKTVLLFCIAAITFFAYLPALENNFTNWDDDSHITGNADIRSVSPASLKRIFCSMFEDQYRPLTFLSFALEYKAVGLKPFLYHFDNVVLHVLNTLLVFWLFILLSGRMSLAALVALFFGIHPMHVESVAWATERKDLLYGFFFLASLISYVYYKKKDKVLYLCLSSLLFLVSLLAKQQALFAFFILLLLDYFLFHTEGTATGQKKNGFLSGWSSHGWKRSILEKLPFLILMFVFIPVLLEIIGGEHASGKTSLTVAQYILNACYAIVFYIYKLILPLDLSCLYPLPWNEGAFVSAVYRISPALVALISLAVWKSVCRTHKVLFAYLFFIVDLLIILRVYPMSPVVVADRYVYIASLGYFYLISEAMLWLYDRKWKSSGDFRSILSLVLVLVTTVMLFQTWSRCAVWKDSITLWTDALEKNPSLDIAHNNLGNALADAGSLEEAIAHYKKAVQLNPAFVSAYSNLGNALVKAGMFDEALACLSEAMRIDSKSVFVHISLGNVLRAKGRIDDAILQYKEVLRLDPDFAPGYYNMGVALAEKGNFEEAVGQYLQALHLNPGNAEAHNNLGTILASQGKLEAAVQHFQEAISLKPAYLEAHLNLGIALTQQHKFSEAITRYNEVLRLRPGHEMAKTGLENVKRMMYSKSR